MCGRFPVSAPLKSPAFSAAVGTLAELAGYFAEAPARGEVTVVVAGTGKARPRPEPAPDPAALARTLLAEGMTRKDVVERVTEATGIPRNTAYRLVNEL